MPSITWTSIPTSLLDARQEIRAVGSGASRFGGDGHNLIGMMLPGNLDEALQGGNREFDPIFPEPSGPGKVCAQANDFGAAGNRPKPIGTNAGHSQLEGVGADVDRRYDAFGGGHDIRLPDSSPAENESPVNAESVGASMVEAPVIGR